MDKWIQKINKTKERVFLGTESKAMIRGRLVAHMHTHPWRAESAINRFLGLAASRTALTAGVLVFTVTGASVSFASQGSLPGETLYAVKQFTEEVRSVLAFRDEDKAEWEAERTERRLEELTRLAALEERPVAAAFSAPTQMLQMEDTASRKSAASGIEGGAHKGVSPLYLEAQHRFEAQAAKAKERLEDLEKKGDISTASNVALRIETSLRLQKKILEIVDGQMAGVKQRGEFEVEALRDVRAKLERKAAGNSAEAQKAARARILGAENALKSAERALISKEKETSLPPKEVAKEAIKEAETSLRAARDALRGKNIQEVLNRAGEAAARAEGARLIINAGPLPVEIGPEDLPTPSDSAQVQKKASGTSESGAGFDSPGTSTNPR